MGDWTTRKLSGRVEIDLHPDLDSFPLTIRASDIYDSEVTIVLSKKETYKLMLELTSHFKMDLPGEASKKV